MSLWHFLSQEMQLFFFFLVPLAYMYKGKELLRPEPALQTFTLSMGINRKEFILTNVFAHQFKDTIENQKLSLF